MIRMRSAQTHRIQAALLSASAAFVFFTLVWHFAAHLALATAAGFGLMMGLVILASGWYRPRRRR
jgi:hypothetical protein